MADVKCCVECGRWGAQQYRPADNGADGFVCTNDRACRARVVGR